MSELTGWKRLERRLEKCFFLPTQNKGRPLR